MVSTTGVQQEVIRKHSYLEESGVRPPCDHSECRGPWGGLAGGAGSERSLSTPAPPFGVNAANSRATPARPDLPRPHVGWEEMGTQRARPLRFGEENRSSGCHSPLGC